MQCEFTELQGAWLKELEARVWTKKTLETK